VLAGYSYGGTRPSVTQTRLACPLQPWLIIWYPTLSSSPPIYHCTVCDSECLGAPIIMATSSRRASQVPSTTVNLHCNQCNNHLGSFENEWIRLTTSYVRCAQPGTHLGTEVGNKTQVVPNGVAQQAAEGCTMADVFCKNCSTTVAQYCKATSTPEQSKLMYVVPMHNESMDADVSQ
jgi:RNase P subunit RPR2